MAKNAMNVAVAGQAALDAAKEKLAAAKAAYRAGKAKYRAALANREPSEVLNALALGGYLWNGGKVPGMAALAAAVEEAEGELMDAQIAWGKNFDVACKLVAKLAA